MTEQEHIRRAKKLTRRFDQMRIIGSRGEWSGNARQGFMFNPKRGGGSTGGVTPVTPTGACCHGGDCSITTQSLCEGSGGEYQGDNTSCDPNPCPSSGACCLNGGCSIETQSDCEGAGGAYQGDGTTCESVDCCQATSGACCVGTDCSIRTPCDCDDLGGTYYGDGSTCDLNPCVFPDCSCGFLAYDGSGRQFLTQTAVLEVNEQHTTFPECSLTYDGTEVVTFSLPDCTLTAISCDGGGAYDYEGCGSGTLSVEHRSDRCCIPTGEIACGNCPGFYLGNLTECPRAFASQFNESLPLTVEDATHAYRDGSGDGNTIRVDIYLSNECNPI